MHAVLQADHFDHLVANVLNRGAEVSRRKAVARVLSVSLSLLLGLFPNFVSISLTEVVSPEIRSAINTRNVKDSYPLQRGSITEIQGNSITLMNR